MIRRPIGAIAVALAFEAISLACVAFALGMFPELSLGAPQRIAFGLSSITSALVALSLYRVRPWAHLAARSWSATALASAAMLLAPPLNADPLVVIALVVPIALATWFLESYVPRLVQAAV